MNSDDLAELVEAPISGAVIWLDNLERYLVGPHRVTADTIRGLLQSKKRIVVVATMWPTYYYLYSATPQSQSIQDDRYRTEREVVALADVIDVKAEWSDAEIHRAEEIATEDGTIHRALQACDGRFSPPRVLAAVPQLEQRWRHAMSGTGNPFSAALLVAAVDCSRLALQDSIPAELLRAACVGYCEDRARATAPPDWFNVALDYATETLLGATSALEPVPGGRMGNTIGYRVNDYILQRGTEERRRAPVPKETWDALLANVKRSTEARTLSEAAQYRGLYGYAIEFGRKAVSLGGGWQAPWGLAYLLNKIGDRRSAIEVARQSYEGGELALRSMLASLLYSDGNVEEAISLQREEAASGEGVFPFSQLASMLEEQGDIDGAISAADRAAHGYELGAATRYFRLIDSQADSATLRERAAAGDMVAIRGLSNRLIEAGDVAGAMKLLQDVAEFGASWVVERLARLLFDEGDVLGAIDLIRNARTKSVPLVTRTLVELLARTGDLVAAVEIVADEHDSGNYENSDLLASLLTQLGDHESACNVLWNAFTSPARLHEYKLITYLSGHNGIEGLRKMVEWGEPYAADELAKLLAEQDDIDGVRSLAAVHGGVPTELYADMLLARGDTEGAIAALEKGANEYYRRPASKLAKLAAEENSEEALEALRRAADKRRHYAAEVLIEYLVAREDENAIRAEVSAANTHHAFEGLTTLISRVDPGRGARLRRFGLNPDGTDAESRTVHTNPPLRQK